MSTLFVHHFGAIEEVEINTANLKCKNLGFNDLDFSRSSVTGMRHKMGSDLALEERNNFVDNK